MKQILWSLAFVLTFSVISIQQLSAAGIEFFHGTWEEGLALAKAQDKVIFVDGFTTWCGPCKRMAATVFTDPAVGDFYNENFICMKIDMEKEEGIRFQQKYPVTAFPTLYYIDGDGKTVFNTKGAQPADKFIEMGRMVLGKIDKSGDYAVEYEAGNRDPELILKYVKALNKAGKPSGMIANEYINSQQDLTTDFNLRFLLAATTEADSRIFDFLVKNKDRAIAVESKEVVDGVIEKACEETVKKAIEFSSSDLLAEAQDKMKQNLPEKADEFAMMSDMRYFKAKGDAKNYLKVCNSFIKKEVKNNAAQLHNLAKEISDSFAKDDKAMSQAEKLARQAAETGGLAPYYYTYAIILKQNKKETEALAAAQKSLELAKGSPQEESIAIQLIRALERT